jgi:hypothetical protein
MMANDDSRRRPKLARWADVDPARYPFDPAGVQAVVRSAVAAIPPPAPTREAAFRWNMAMSEALVRHYGPWAADWFRSPGSVHYDGVPAVRWDILGLITTSAAETTQLVSAEVVRWRRWLEQLAELFDRFLPSLGPMAPNPNPNPDRVTVWEAAVAQLVTMSVARVDDDDLWQGVCEQVLVWFLTAAGVPEQRSAMLVDGVLYERFRGWVSLTAADVTDIAERLAREVTGAPAGGAARAGQGTDAWPDTWPRGWPSWRATNEVRRDS